MGRKKEEWLAPLLLVRFVFDDVSWLAIQQSADCVDCCGRYGSSPLNPRNDAIRQDLFPLQSVDCPPDFTEFGEHLFVQDHIEPP